jgi:hypothetical protein
MTSDYLDLIRQLTPVERLCHWITQREAIRRKRQAGETPPWTLDPILQTYSFTNVRRWDDRVSQWLWNNWYKPNLGHPNMVYAIATARFFNQPSSLDLITDVVFGEKWNPREIKKRLRKHKRAGNTVFRAAYLVRGNDGEDKIESVVDHNVGKLVGAEIHEKVDTTSMYKTWAEVEKVHGFGSFMAGQVTADLRHVVAGSWEDKLAWAPLGPGSLKGMNILLERDLKTPMSQKEFGDRLLWLMEELLGRVDYSTMSRLEMFDVQNCCCEYSKYSRTLLGLGRPKRLYRYEVGGPQCPLFTW